MWTERKFLAIPADLVNAANAIANVLDPDVGGALTFRGPTHSAGGAPPATHCVAISPFAPAVWDLIIARDPDVWEGALVQYSAARGRPMPSRAEIDAACDALMIQPGNLQPVPSDP